MKFSSLHFIGILPIMLFISCSSDSDNSSSSQGSAEEQTAENFQGEWFVTSLRYDDCLVTDWDGQVRDFYKTSPCTDSDDDPCTYHKWIFTETEWISEVNEYVNGNVSNVTDFDFVYMLIPDEGRFCIVFSGEECGSQGYSYNISGNTMTVILENDLSNSGCKQTWTAVRN